MEFSLLGWVGGFEKVILFYVFSCGLEKIALIGSKNGQTPDFTVVSINYPELCPNRVSILVLLNLIHKLAEFAQISNFSINS